MLRVFEEVWSRMPGLQLGWDGSWRDAAEIVKQHWIGEQIRYHERNSTRCGRQSRRLERGGMIVFIFALAETEELMLAETQDWLMLMGAVQLEAV